MGKAKGATIPENLNNAADVYVYPKTNEVFVADGYVNRRVIVFDATTGALKRYWGAYGNKPDDSGERGSNIQQFAIVHHVRFSNDGLVYVALRQDGRVQVFTLDGKYLKEVFLDKDTKAGTGVASIAFSKDTAQKYIYVLDLSKGLIHRILNRQTLEVLSTIGQHGKKRQANLAHRTISPRTQKATFTFLSLATITETSGRDVYRSSRISERGTHRQHPAACK